MSSLSPNTRLRWRPLALAAVVASTLAACASLSDDGDARALGSLTQTHFSGLSVSDLAATQTAAAENRVVELLKTPLSDQAAVQIAMLHSPAVHAALARLGVSDADRVLASSWPAPHLMIGRLTEGNAREIERGLSFNLLGLLTLPWQSRVQNQQHEINRLQTAQELIRLAANTRKAWVQAVAAQQTARYMADALEAAQASAELAHRMAKAGNWSALQQTREQLQLAEVQAQFKRAQHQALIEREALTRLMGLSGEQAAFRLPERLPDLPVQIPQQGDVQAKALRERLDVLTARTRTLQMAGSAGLDQWQAWAKGMELGLLHNSTLDRATGASTTKNGWELTLPLPLVGTDARQARADALLRESAARLREASVVASSEARQAWSAYASAHALARQYRDEVLPLRQKLSEEILLRYNGMLLGVFDVLADARTQIATVNAALQAERDFWLAQTDLDTALTGTSPQGMAALQASANASPAIEQGH